MKGAWAAFTALAAAVAALIAAAIADMAKDEIRSRIAQLPRVLLCLAIRRLPPDLRDTFRDEWQAELAAIEDVTQDVPITGLIKALWYVTGLVIHSPMIGRAFSGAEQHPRLAKLHAFLSAPIRYTEQSLRKFTRPANAGLGLRGPGSPSSFIDGTAALRKGAAILTAGAAVLTMAYIAQPWFSRGPSIPSHTFTPTGAAGTTQAASSLAELLALSVSDRKAVNSAFNDVLQCGPNLGQDAQVFRNAAASRRQLQAQLKDMPGRAALPSEMLQDISQAWGNSARVDDDYMQWANDASTGCTANSTSDPAWVSAENSNIETTAEKAAFTRSWDSIAAEYGLASYQLGDL